ncbi:MAG: pyridoxal phosphate-dependent aminotransferase [Thermoplasmatota archaeon]
MRDVKLMARGMYDILGEGAFTVLARAKELERKGRDIIHFEIGEPDFPTPGPVVEAVKKALDEKFTKYVSADGIPELKEAIAEDIKRTRGFKPDLDQILVLPGCKPGIFFSMTGLIDPGDEVIYPDPGFPTYRSVIRYIGAKGIPIPLLEKNDFRMSPDHIRERITGKTKLIIINSPQNPTGSVIKPEEIKEIAEIAEEHDTYLLTDEIYSKMLYDEAEFSSPASYDQARERTVLLDGLSKSYSMTGWRIGYAIGPKDFIARMNLLSINAISCTTSFVQKAAVEALRGDQSFLREMMQRFSERRRAIVDGLNTVEGFSCLPPKGAFYAWPNITGTGLSSQELADKLLEEAGVATLPGPSFGNNGEGYLRFSYPTSVENIQKAVERIREVL